MTLTTLSANAMADDPTPPAPWSPPVITPLKKDQPAPFTGVLLTPQAIAEIIALVKECPVRVQIETDRAREEQRIKDEKVLDDTKSTAERDRKILQAELDTKNAMIKLADAKIKQLESSGSNNWLWLSGGALGGAVLVIGTVVLVSHL